MFRSFKFGTLAVGYFLNVSSKLVRRSSSVGPRVISLDERIKGLLRRYEDIFGLTKLAEMHDNVLKAQSRLQEAQVKRRKIQADIITVQGTLQDIQAKLEKIPRGDDMFLSTVTQEHELLKEQKKLQTLLAVCDRTEREEQESLAYVINMSQNHERTYREKNKYLSLIAGVIGGLIGVIGSSANNWNHKKDIRLFTNKISSLIKENSSEFSENSLHYKSMIEDIMKSVTYLSNLFSPTSDATLIIQNLEEQTNNLLSLVRTQNDALSNVVQQINSFLDEGNSEDYSIEKLYSDLYTKKILEEVDMRVEKKVKSHFYYTVLFLSSTFLLISVLHIINNH